MRGTSEAELANALESVASFLASGLQEKALAVTEDILSLWPKRGEGYFCLAIIAYKYDQLGDALSAAEKALELNDQVREFAVLMEGLCGEAGRLNDALYYAKLGVALPQNPDLLRMVPPALQSFIAAVDQVREDHGHIVQAMLAFNLRKFSEAIEHCQLQLKVNAENPALFVLMGRAMVAVGDFDQAVLAFRAALQLSGDDALLTLVYLAEAYAHAGMDAESRNALDDALDSGSTADDVLAAAIRVLALASGNEAEIQSLIATLADKDYRDYRSEFSPEPCTDGKIRLGILSDRLYDTPEGHAVRALLYGLPRDRFEVRLYIQNILKDQLTDDLKNAATDWREVFEIDDKTLFLILQRDGSDVLIDMCGYGEAGRLALLAAQPGGARYGWWTQPGFLAVRGCDGFLVPADSSAVSDRSDPEGARALTVEGSLCVYAPPFGFEAPCQNREGAGPVFGARLDGAALDDKMLGDCVALLTAFPSARIRLGLVNTVSQSVLASLQEKLADPALADRFSLHLPGEQPDLPGAFFNTIDVFLAAGADAWLDDTLLALWMGVPCLAVRRFGNRMIRHALAQAERASWVAADRNALVAMAAELLAGDGSASEARAQRREQVLQSPLCDLQAFTDDFAKTVERIHRAHPTDEKGGGA